MSARPTSRVIGLLLAGRSAFRGSVVLSAPLLLAVWGNRDFAPYAVAVGTMLVLNPLVGSGAEKSAGLLLGRSAAHGRDLATERLLAAHLIVVGLAATVSLVAAAALATWLRGNADLYLMAAVTSVGFGAVQALVAYWRVLGRPLVDAASHAVLAVVTLLAIALAAWAGAGPRTVLAVQAVAAISIAVVLGLAFRHRVARFGRADLVVTARTTALMGANTLLAVAGFSVVFAVLAQRGLITAAGHLYLAVVGYTVLANLLDYLLRIFQPWLATSLGNGAEAAVRTAERATRIAIAVLIPFAAAATVLIGRRLSGVAEATAAVSLVAPALLLAAALVWLLENLDAGSLTATVVAGVLGLAATAASVSALPAEWAVSGSALALLAGAALTAIALLPVLRRRASALNLTAPLASTLGRQQ